MNETTALKDILSRIPPRFLTLGVEREQKAYTASSLQILESLGQHLLPHFVLDKYNTFVYENLLKWLHGIPTFQAHHPRSPQTVQGRLSKGIYLSGATGTGKTIALYLLDLYSAAMSFKVIYPDELDLKRRVGLLQWRSVPAEQITSDFSTTKDISQYVSRRILCIEDLGREPKESLCMGNRLNVLKSILEARGDNPNTLTLITSNLSLDNPELLTRYGDRVVSRLYEMCNYYELGGSDRRIDRYEY